MDTTEEFDRGELDPDEGEEDFVESDFCHEPITTVGVLLIGVVGGSLKGSERSRRGNELGGVGVEEFMR